MKKGRPRLGFILTGCGSPGKEANTIGIIARLLEDRLEPAGAGVGVKVAYLQFAAASEAVFRATGAQAVVEPCAILGSDVIDIPEAARMSLKEMKKRFVQ
jgi:hypothetical protein